MGPEFLFLLVVLISLIVNLFWCDRRVFWKVDAVIMWLEYYLVHTHTASRYCYYIGIRQGFGRFFVAVGLTMWVEVARVVRGQVISVKEMQYVTARALGFGDFNYFNHILPIMAPVIVISAANFASAILVESGLSFLGLGAQPLYLVGEV
jgi:peptide/nickel transport system permease protein